MKNSEIHKGLDKKEIRDFLSLSLVKLMEEQINISKSNIIIPRSDDTYGYSIELAKRDIEYHSNLLQIYKNIQAIIQIAKMNGWEEFDVSDITTKDIVNHKLKMNFIGTKKEYDFLLLQINGD